MLRFISLAVGFAWLLYFVEAWSLARRSSKPLLDVSRSLSYQQ